MIKRKVENEVTKIQKEPSVGEEYRDMFILDDGDARPVSAVLTQP